MEKDKIIEFKGTEGKWLISMSSFSNTIKIVCSTLGNRYEIAKCEFLPTLIGDKKEVEANMLLMSRAPEMLKLLMTVREGIDTMDFYQLETIHTDIEELIKDVTDS